MRHMLIAGGIVVLGLVQCAAGRNESLAEETRTWDFFLSPGQATLNFARFDTMGGSRILKRVTVELDGEAHGNIEVENTSSLPLPDFGVTWSGSINFDAASGAIQGGGVGGPTIETHGLGPADNGGIPNSSGSDYHDFGTLSFVVTDTQQGSTNLDLFTAPGPDVPVVVTASGEFSLNAQSALTAQFSGLRTTGLVTLRYEYTPSPCAGDANGDGLVNGADLSVLLSQFGSSVPSGPGADFNHDGKVDSADLSVLLANFGTTC